MKEYCFQHKFALGLTILFLGFIILVFFVNIAGLMNIQEEYRPYIRNEWYQASGVFKIFTLLIAMGLTFSYKKDEPHVRHIAFNKSLVIFIVGMLGAILARDAWLYATHIQNKKDITIDNNFHITKDSLLTLEKRIDELNTSK